MLPSSSNIYYVNNSHISGNEKSAEDGKLNEKKRTGTITFKDNSLNDKAGRPEELLCQDDFENIESDGCENVLREILELRIKQLIEKLSRFKGVSISVAKASLIILLVVYLAWCIDCSKLKSAADIQLVLIICVGLFFLVYNKCKEHIPQYFINNNSRLSLKCIARFKEYVDLTLAIMLIISLIIYIIVDVGRKNPYNFISICGILFFTLICFALSASIREVKWRPVISGLVVQFLIAIFILKTKIGFLVFSSIGKGARDFLQHTDAGMNFIFGEKYYYYPMTFKILPSIVFFSSIIAILYHVGVLQFMVRHFGWVMHKTMGTTAGESLNAAGSIFFGFVDAPLIIKCMIGRMTNSELHAVMSCGFATISGSMLPAFIFLGMSPTHLIGASVMSAPAALALSKLVYPETKKSKTTYKEVKNMAPSPYRNLIDAASGGARDSIALISNIIVNIITFMGLHHFMNGVLIWLGKRACLTDNLTFELIFSYALRPLPVLMGVDAVDCKKVAELLGIKVFLNVIIAYQKLGNLIRNRKTLNALTSKGLRSIHLPNGDILINNGISNITLFGGVISPRSEAIATYSLCGFSGIAGIGIAVGILSVLAPHRRSDITKLVVGALIVGNLASYMTASVAALLID